MSGAGKYANLPDLDIAPDVYETPDLADDISTIQDTSARSLSTSEDNGEHDDQAADTSGIDRRKLTTDEARGRFQSTRVDARGVDFSDRASASRRYYRTADAQRRKHRPADGDYASSSDSEDESLDQRLVRLRREIEEVKIVAEERQLSEIKKAHVPDAEAVPQAADEIQQLSDALDAVYDTRSSAQNGLEDDFLQKLQEPRAALVPATKPENDRTSRQAPAPHDQSQISRALAKAAEFDERLAHLERALGLDGTNLPDQGLIQARPVLQSLEYLHRQIEILSNAPETVEVAQQSTKQLVKEVERLQKLRVEESAPTSTAQPAKAGNEPSSDAYARHSDQITKINALYGALPTIDSFSPTLPLVLERLRTLQALHGSAAAASRTLDEIEKRQDEQENELRQWQLALNKVESGLRDGEGSLMENVKSVGDWVKNLENRINRFS